MSESTPFRGEVYAHYCELSQKWYVGQTTRSMEERWADHIKSSRAVKTLSYNAPVSRAIRKHGAESFEHQILSVAKSPAELDELEKLWILLLQTKVPNGYNIQAGGGLWTPERRCNMQGSREVSPEGLAALQEVGRRRKGAKQPREAVEKTAAANRGRKNSPESLAKMSAAQKGKKLSTETKAKLSAAKLGKKRSVESCAKQSATLNRPEVRAAKSERAKAQFSSPEARAANSARAKAWCASPENIEKLSVSAKKKCERDPELYAERAAKMRAAKKVPCG